MAKTECKECDILPAKEGDLFPFCSQLCHDTWSDREYKDAKPLGGGKKADLAEKLKRWKPERRRL